MEEGQEPTEASSGAVEDEPSAPPTTETRSASATPRPRAETRYPLAYDANGNPIVLPANAVAWRVRRGGGRRGRPRNVFDPSTGRQLELPLGASIEDLAETHVAADRYLLYPIDREGVVLPGLVAVTELPEDEDDEFVDDDEARRTITTHSRDPALAFVAEQRETIAKLTDLVKAQSTNLTGVVNAAISGYGRVKALPAPDLPPTPMIIEPSAPPGPPPPPSAGSMLATTLVEMISNPANLVQVVMMVKQAMEGMSAAASTAPSAPARPVGVP